MNTRSLYSSVVGAALCGLLFASPSKAEAVWNGETFGAYSGVSGHPFRQHPATCSGVSGHL
jgi:hypothetical protein